MVGRLFKDRPVMVKLSMPAYNRLKKAADKAGESISEYIRMLIRREEERTETRGHGV